jgi:hypothetical protein
MYDMFNNIFFDVLIVLMRCSTIFHIVLVVCMSCSIVLFELFPQYSCDVLHDVPWMFPILLLRC